jgi:hypothetical protein
MRLKPLRLVAILLFFLLFAFSGSAADQVRQIMRQDDDFSSANEIREGETIVKLSSHPDNTGDYYHINLLRPGPVTITLSAFPAEGAFRIGALGFDASSPTGWIPGTNEVESQPGANSLQMKFTATKGLSGYIRISFNTASGICGGGFCALRLTSQGPWYLKPIREAAPVKPPADVEGIPLMPQLSYRLTVNVGEFVVGASKTITWANEEKSIREKLAAMTVALRNKDAGTLANFVVLEYRNSFQSRYSREPESFFSKSEPLDKAVLFYLSDKPTDGESRYERTARLMTDDSGEMIYIDMVKQNGQWYFKHF